MEELFEGPDDAATPLAVEERRDLIPSYIAYRRELNHAEQENILRALDWVSGRKNRDLLNEKFLCQLHRHMFGEVWRWAGKFRTSARNIGVDHWLIGIELKQLIGDAKAWIEFGSYSRDEIAVRFHHRLVAIHPFPNGNGRHARLVADLLVVRLGGERFSWGRAGLINASETRQRYIAALRAADRHDLSMLLLFARS